MRHLGISISLILLIVVGSLSCKKWEDPAPVDDARISRPYCNDPTAVNYNWNFPGKPDNTTCYYPSDLFVGNYTLNDTIYDDKDVYLAALTRDISLTKVSYNQVAVNGLCDFGSNLVVTAWAPYFAAVDTTVGDTLSESQGQLFCRTQDTVTGYFSRDKIDSSLVYIELTVKSDTGRTIHRAFARKKK